MSTSLHVGWLADDERLAQKRLAALNEALRADGITTPVESGHHGDGWSFQLRPANGLAFLQRLAAYCSLRTEDGRIETWPTPGDPSVPGNPLEDELVDEAYRLQELLPFPHLILHDPRWGFWLPVDFPDVLCPDAALGIGSLLGSSVRLAAECEELARLLQLPLEPEPRASPLAEATARPDADSPGWQRYGVESFNLSGLYRACRKSLEWGSAIYVV